MEGEREINEGSLMCQAMIEDLFCRGLMDASGSSSPVKLAVCMCVEEQ